MAGRIMKVFRMPVAEASRLAGSRVRKALRRAKPYVLPILLMPLGMTMGMVSRPSGAKPAKSRKEFEEKGIAVTDRIAIGTALVIDEVLELKDYPLIDLKAEAENRGLLVEDVLKERMDRVVEAFRVLEKNLVEDKGQIAQSLYAVLMDIKTKLLESMKKSTICARGAVDNLLGSYDGLKESPDEKLRSLYEDILKICTKMLAIKHHKAVEIRQEVDLMGRDDVVIIAKDISPSDVGLVNDERIVGYVREEGSRKDHMSLRIKNRGRAGLVGANGAKLKVKTGDRIIIDGRSGKFAVNPSTKTLREYRLKIKKLKGILEPLKALRGLPAKLKDGHLIKLMGNAANPEEAKDLWEYGAEGIGLVRTEFFFIYHPDNSPRNSAPTVEEQIEFYNSIIAAAQGKELIFRTIDPDKDKSFPYFERLNGLISEEKKRGLALCLDKEKFGPYHFSFRNQIRAFLQTEGKIKVMFPLVKSKEEFFAVMDLIGEIKAELTEKGKKINKQIKFGIMVEHPEILQDLSALMQDERLKFNSLGSNDLTQYVTRIDRYSEVASQYFDELDPRVIEVIKEAIILSQENGIEISLCGDMGNDWRGLLVLLGLGLRNISFSTDFMDVARKIIHSVYYEDLKVMVENIQKIKTAGEIRKYIEEFTRDKIRSGRWTELVEIENILFES